MTDATDLIVTAAYERAAGALAGAVDEMRELGRPLPEGAQVILLKHLLAHFDGLEAQCRGLLDRHLEDELLATLHESRRAGGSSESGTSPDDAPPG